MKKQVKIYWNEEKNWLRIFDLSNPKEFAIVHNGEKWIESFLTNSDINLQGSGWILIGDMCECKVMVNIRRGING